MAGVHISKLAGVWIQAGVGQGDKDVLSGSNYLQQARRRRRQAANALSNGA